MQRTMKIRLALVCRMLPIFDVLVCSDPLSCHKSRVNFLISVRPEDHRPAGRQSHGRGGHPRATTPTVRRVGALRPLHQRRRHGQSWVQTLPQGASRGHLKWHQQPVEARQDLQRTARSASGIASTETAAAAALCSSNALV
jgi:hypothetical protein